MNEDKATRYQRARRRLNLTSAVWTATLLAGFLLTGGSVALRIAAETASRALARPQLEPFAAMALFVIVLMAVWETGRSLIAWAQRSLDQRYGRATEPTGVWLADRVRSRAIALAAGLFIVTALYAGMRATPNSWWLVCGIALAVIRLAAARYAPVWLFRLLHRARPLADEALRTRLRDLTRDAQAGQLAAYTWCGDADDGKAVVAGVGSTRALYISQRMLAEYSLDEIEVVAAHELAHDMHGDVWKGAAVEAGVTAAGLWLAAVVLATWSEYLGLSSPSDVAGLPLVVLSVGAVSIASRPLVHALSRAAERRADRVALERTGNPHAFIAVVRRLANEHLAEDMPSRMVAWLWHGHPPINERIAAARVFEAGARHASDVRRVG